MTAPAPYGIESSEGGDGTMRPVEQPWMPGEDAVEIGFIIHRGLYVTGIDDPTDDHFYPVGFVVLGHQRWADVIEAATAYMGPDPWLAKRTPVLGR
ncbi:hypothetical protein [Streptomyces murinus]|uniref:hypothetical protein n=1 Tax=Streptomyces murinus TaxID=33900 RepID=UPI0038287833